MTRSGMLSLLCLALCLPVQATGGMQAAIEERTTPREDAQHLEARGPGAVFASIEAAAIDALTYAYLQSRSAREADPVRGGAIHRSDAGFSYAEIHVARRTRPHRITYHMGPRDVARFVVYPRVDDLGVDRANERPSRVDRRSVSVVDPLHRPLFILTPSLAIRAYRGEGSEIVDVANLRRPGRALRLVAGN